MQQQLTLPDWLTSFLSQVFTWMREHPLWILGLFLAAIVVNGVGFLWQLRRYRKAAITFPKVDLRDAIFHEEFVSGQSLKNLQTRMGGASRCLKVTVTASEVWVRSFGPFSVFTFAHDLVHRIPRQDIVRIEPLKSLAGGLVRLEFRKPDGELCRLNLWFRDPQRFVSALNSPPPLPK